MGGSRRDDVSGTRREDEQARIEDREAFGCCSGRGGCACWSAPLSLLRSPPGTDRSSTLGCHPCARASCAADQLDSDGAVLPAERPHLRRRASSSSCPSTSLRRRSSPSTRTSRPTRTRSSSTRRTTSSDVVERLGLGGESFVVEVASNDGYLLQHFVERGIPVLGVEPAGTSPPWRSNAASPRVSPSSARKPPEALVREGPSADLIIGNNVLSQAPHLNDFVAGLKRCSRRAARSPSSFRT